MKRLLALSLLGIACTAAGCSLDLDDTDQHDTGMGDDQDDPGPPDLPGDDYRQCVLQTLDECDAADLSPDECTALIAANCNTLPPCDPDGMDPDGNGECQPPCDPWTDPMGCLPPPDDCYQTVFDQCVAAGIDPQECAQRADEVCNPQCDPGDPNCCMPDGTGQCCDPAGGMDCPPPPCDPMTGQNCCPDGSTDCPPGCDPTTGMGCDCWSQVFEECVASGIDPMECAQRADEVCYPPPPPPCDPMTGENCCPDGGTDCPPPVDCWSQVFEECVAAGIDPMECAQRADEVCFPPPPPPCDPMTGENCCPDGSPDCPPPPPPCDPMDPTCCPDGTGGCFPPPPPCDPMDPDCNCTDPSDPGCYPPPPCDPTDPMCWPYKHT